MRDMFAGYYTPTPEEFKKLWRDAIFTLDANILLNIYRYSPKTTEVFFKIIKHFGTRVWVSHQAALEFQQNRLQVISDQISVYTQIPKALKEIADKTDSLKLKHHPYLDTGVIVERVSECVGKVIKQIEQTKAGHPDYLENDPLRQELTNLLESKVGQPYSREDLQKIYKDGDQRYKEKIPPGYADQKEKASPDCFGDFVLWRQLLDYGKQQNGVSMILATDDSKEDWWAIHRGRTIGPRPELIQEMLSVAKSRFYLYSGDQFLQHALQFLGDKIDIVAADQAKAIEEAKVVRDEAAASDEAKAVLGSPYSIVYSVGHNEFLYQEIHPIVKRIVADWRDLESKQSPDLPTKKLLADNSLRLFALGRSAMLAGFPAGGMVANFANQLAQLCSKFCPDPEFLSAGKGLITALEIALKELREDMVRRQR